MTDEAAAAKPAEMESKPAAPAEAGKAESNANGESKQGSWVEMDPQTQARFNQVWGHLKQYEKTTETLAQQNAKLLEKLEQFEAAERKKSTAGLLAEKKKALEDGDADRLAAIDDRILEARLAERETAKAKVEKPPEQQAAPPFQFTPEQERTLMTWAGERDDSGNLLRPWTMPDHPKNKRVMSVAVAVLEDPEFQGKPMPEILAEVDRLMNVEKPQRTRAAVMSSDPDIRPKERKQTQALSEDEKFIARKMYSDMKPDEAYKRYQKAKELMA